MKVTTKKQSPESTDVGCGIALISGRMPQMKSGVPFELTNVLLLPMKAETVTNAIERVAKDERYPREFVSVRRSFMARLARYSESCLRAAAAGAVDLDTETVRLLAKDSNEEVLEVLADNSEFLKLSADEQVQFCRRHIEYLDVVVRTYIYRAGPWPVPSPIPAFIKAFADHSDPHVRNAVDELPASFISDRADSFCDGPLAKRMKVRHGQRRRGFEKLLKRYCLEWAKDIDVQSFAERLEASTHEMHCTDTNFGRPGEYAYAFALINREDEPNREIAGSRQARLDPEEPLLMIPLYVLSELVCQIPNGPAGEALIDRLASHPAHSVREAVAGRRDLPAAIVERLAKDEWPCVRKQLNQAKTKAENA